MAGFTYFVIITAVVIFFLLRRNSFQFMKPVDDYLKPPKNGLRRRSPTPSDDSSDYYAGAGYRMPINTQNVQYQRIEFIKKDRRSYISPPLRKVTPRESPVPIESPPPTNNVPETGGFSYSIPQRYEPPVAAPVRAPRCQSPLPVNIPASPPPEKKTNPPNPKPQPQKSRQKDKESTNTPSVKENAGKERREDRRNKPKAEETVQETSEPAGDEPEGGRGRGRVRGRGGRGRGRGGGRGRGRGGSAAPAE